MDKAGDLHIRMYIIIIIIIISIIIWLIDYEFFRQKFAAWRKTAFECFELDPPLHDLGNFSLSTALTLLQRLTKSID